MVDIDLRVETWGQLFDFLIQEFNETTKVWDAVDISAATFKRLYFRRPDNTLLEVTPTFKTTGTDGYLRWTILEGQLRKQDEGEWRVEAEVRGVTNFNGPTNPAAFRVQGRVK